MEPENEKAEASRQQETRNKEAYRDKFFSILWFDDVGLSVFH
jgi:hypothetical protein